MSGPSSSSFSVASMLASSSLLITTHPVSSPASCHDRVGCRSLCGRCIHIVHIPSLMILTFVTDRQYIWYILNQQIFDIFDRYYFHLEHCYIIKKFSIIVVHRNLPQESVPVAWYWLLGVASPHAELLWWISHPNLHPYCFLPNPNLLQLGIVSTSSPPSSLLIFLTFSQTPHPLLFLSCSSSLLSLFLFGSSPPSAIFVLFNSGHYNHSFQIPACTAHFTNACQYTTAALAHAN